MDIHIANLIILFDNDQWIDAVWFPSELEWNYNLDVSLDIKNICLGHKMSSGSLLYCSMCLFAQWLQVAEMNYGSS